MMSSGGAAMNIPASSFNDSSERRSSLLRSLSDYSKQHRAAHWTGSFAKFLEAIFPADPHGLARSSHQYVWDMMRAEGFDDTKGRLRCQLFEDELYGINDTIERLVDYFKAASAGSEVGRRLLLLLGPPSGGKSSLVILLKRGLEEYSHTDAGAMYAIHGCPVHESPLHPRDDRDPEGEARVPVPAAHADAGKERQGVALPADLSRRDRGRAHQPRRVPQVPAGGGERGAARPHGHHPGALHPVLQGRGAHLPQAHLLDPGVPRGAPRPARVARGGGVLGADAAAGGRGARRRQRQAGEGLRRRGRRGRAAIRDREDARAQPGRGPPGRVAAHRS